MAMDPMMALSNSLAEVTARVGASVLRVEGRRRPSSGVAFSSDVVVTASHALEHDEIEVGLPDGRILAAQVAGRDAATDLAALRIDGAKLSPATWLEDAASETVKVGNLVLAVSRPGRTARAAIGVVSALSEGEWRSPGGGRLDRYLESDVQLRPGFSGSALVDAGGRVIGLNTTGLLRGSASAVPAATVRRLITALLAHGVVPRGYLGVSTFPARLPEQVAKSLGQEAALLVAAVDPESPAAKAGIILGDVLLAIEGHSLAHPGELLELLDEKSVGKTVGLRLLRAGEVRDLPLSIGQREARP